jgi:hypothetical protein
MRQAFMITPETLLGSVRYLSPRQSVSEKKAAPNNPARMVVARQRLIYYRRRRADHTDQSDQPARTTSQSFFNRRQVVGFQAERPQGIQIPPNSPESHLPEMLRRSDDVPSRIEFRCGLLVAVKDILATAEHRRCLRRRVKEIAPASLTNHCLHIRRTL